MDFRIILNLFIVFALLEICIGAKTAKKVPSTGKGGTKTAKKVPSTGTGGTKTAKKVPSTGKGGTDRAKVPGTGTDSGKTDYYYYNDDEPTTTETSLQQRKPPTTTTRKPVIKTTTKPVITTTTEPVITTTTTEPVITTTTTEPVITTTTTTEPVITTTTKKPVIKTTTKKPVITTTTKTPVITTTTTEPVITTTTTEPVITTTTTEPVITTTTTEPAITTGHVTKTHLSSTTTTSNTVPTIASNSKTSATTTSGIDVTKSLHNEIFKNYDTQVRPLINQSDSLHVQTLFIPNSLLEFDVRTQKLSVLGYFRIDWYDELINWWPRNYDHIFRVKVPVTDIWYPKLFISKAYGGDGHIGNTVTDIAQIAYRGWVQWVPDGTYSIVCDVDIKYYPFDEQVCHLSYYIMGGDLDSVELHHEEDVDLSELEENSAWEFIEITKTVKTISNNNHVDIQFRLRRRPNFVVFTLVTPLLMMASLNAGVFLVPADSGEKGSFAITIVFTYSIYVTIVSNMFPSTSAKVSYLITFIVVLMSFSVISTFYVIIQAKLLSTKATKSNEHLNKRKEFFRKLDTIIFVVFTAFVISSSVGFFGLLLKMIS